MPDTKNASSVSEPKVADAVFEGGGVKGVGLVGALSHCELEKGYTWKNVAGTSAGAITAALVASGYTAAEIKAELDGLMREPSPDGTVGYERFKDKSLLDQVPLLGPVMSLGLEKGIYEGEFFEEWLRGLLEKKNKHTFADLINPDHAQDAKDSPYRYRLRVVASDITRRRMLVLPQDIADFEEFDGDPDKLEIARAVRMSMSIPFFFEPVELTCMDDRFPRTEEEQGEEATRGKHITFTARQRRCYIVDGGVLSNFPVDLFDAPPDRTPRWPTFGFKLVAPNDDRPNRIGGPLTLFAALFTTMMEAHDQRHMDQETAVRTIKIRTEKVKTTDFDLKPEDSDALYDRGRDGAKQFFECWDAMGGFSGYVSKYRQPTS
ncbi:MAG: patatin-like phospholipase family protein [Terriglobia bacterium]